MDVYVGSGIILNHAAGNEVDFFMFLGKIDLKSGKDPRPVAVPTHDVSNGTCVGATDRDCEAHLAPSRFVQIHTPAKPGLGGDRGAQQADYIGIGTHATDGVLGG